MLGVPFGGLKLVKLSDVVNAPTLMQLEFAKRAFSKQAMQKLLPELEVVKAARTSIEQSGHTITRISVVPDSGQLTPLGLWTEDANPDHIKLYEDYPMIKPDDLALHHFDILIEVAPHPKIRDTLGSP